MSALHAIFSFEENGREMKEAFIGTSITHCARQFKRKHPGKQFSVVETEVIYYEDSIMRDCISPDNMGYYLPAGDD